MTDLVQKTLRRLGEQLPGRLSTPGDPCYADATAVWAKPVGRMPRAVSIARQPKTWRWRFVPPAIVPFPYRCVAEATTGLAAPCATASSST